MSANNNIERAAPRAALGNAHTRLRKALAAADRYGIGGATFGDIDLRFEDIRALADSIFTIFESDSEFYAILHAVEDERDVLEFERTALRAERDELLAVLRYIVDREDLTFAECSVAEDIWGRAKAAITKVEAR